MWGAMTTAPQGVPVRTLPRITLKIMMESATIRFAKYLATPGGTSVHRWAMYTVCLPSTNNVFLQFPCLLL